MVVFLAGALKNLQSSVLGGLKAPLRKSHTRLILRWASTYRWKGIIIPAAFEVNMFVLLKVISLTVSLLSLGFAKTTKLPQDLDKKEWFLRGIWKNIVNDLLKDVAFSCNPPMFRSVTNGAVKKNLVYAGWFIGLFLMASCNILQSTY